MTLETTRRFLEDLLLPAGAEALPIHLIASADDAALQALSEAERAWVEAQDWSGKQGSVLLLPGKEAGLGGVSAWDRKQGLAGASPPADRELCRSALPAGDYRLASPLRRS